MGIVLTILIPIPILPFYSDSLRGGVEMVHMLISQKGGTFYFESNQWRVTVLPGFFNVKLPLTGLQRNKRLEVGWSLWKPKLPCVKFGTGDRIQNQIFQTSKLEPVLDAQSY